jgi:hypothetical protein
MEPALAALPLRPAVPGDPERLQPSARQLEENLLQRRHAEGVLHRVVAQLPVRPVGAHHEAGAVTVEAACDAAKRDLDAREITQHSRVRGVFHRAVVMRTAPRSMFGGMAPAAGVAADIALVHIGRADHARAEQPGKQDDHLGGSDLEHLVAGESRHEASAEHRESPARRPMTTGHEARRAW